LGFHEDVQSGAITASLLEYHEPAKDRWKVWLIHGTGSTPGINSGCDTGERDEVYEENPMRWRRRLSQRILISCSVVTSLALLGWFVRAAVRAREEARSAQCAGKLKQLGLALLNYDSIYGCLPPAYVVSPHGQPLYSWRVVLMAYLERTEGWNDRQLTEKFRFDEPWDSPANRKLHDMRPPNFFCPSCPEHAARGFTCFVAVVGPRTLFPEGGKTRALTDVRDQPKSTLMLVECVNTAIHWMEPRDLDWDRMSFLVNDRSRPSISSEHRAGSHRGPHVIAADDGLAYLDDSMPPALIRALLTIDGGEAAVLHQGPRPQ
jgi:hypothetical protein